MRKSWPADARWPQLLLTRVEIESTCAAGEVRRSYTRIHTCVLPKRSIFDLRGHRRDLARARAGYLQILVISLTQTAILDARSPDRHGAVATAGGLLRGNEARTARDFYSIAQITRSCAHL